MSFLRRGAGWRETTWQVVDVETTGLDAARDEVISYAIVPIRGGRIQSGQHRSGLIRPRRAPGAASIRLHGLRPCDLEDAPAPEEVASLLASQLAASRLVVHYGYVERTFLTPILAAAGMSYPRRVADTEVIGRLWLADQGRRPPRVLPLSQLAQELGLPVHRPHDALGDALTTAQAFLALVAHLEENGPETAAGLLRADQRLANLQQSGAAVS